MRDATYKALTVAGKERMHFRPPDEQNEHKVTCGVKADVIDKVLFSHRYPALRHLAREAWLIIEGSGSGRIPGRQTWEEECGEIGFL